MRGVSEARNQQSGRHHPDGEQSGGRQQPRSVSSMLFAMLPLVLIVLGMAGLTGRCSFSPLGPTVDSGSAPTVDAGVELRRAAGKVDFPVLRPRLPQEWRANSAGVRRVDPRHRAVRVGWLTREDHYLRLSQSSAPESALVRFETEQQPRGRGVVRAAGRTWVVYDSVRSESAWVTERDGVRLLITGSATEREFRTMARAVVRARTVTPQG